jgi:hypothetical protein
MAPRKKQRLIDTSHTFLVPSHVVQSSALSSVNPVAVVDKISADYRRTLPQEHNMRRPTPPPESFFEDFSWVDDQDSTVEPGTSMQSVMDYTLDPIAERRKAYASSVSEVTLFQFITVNSLI